MKRRAVLIGAAAATLAGTIEPVHAVVPYNRPVRSVVSWAIEVEHMTDTLRVVRTFSDGKTRIVWISRSWIDDQAELAVSYGNRSNISCRLSIRDTVCVQITLGQVIGFLHADGNGCSIGI